MRGARISYSAEEMTWLDANRMMVISDYHRAFISTFPRPDVTAEHLHGLRKRKGWKVGRAHGRTAGRSTRFSEAEITFLRENCSLRIDGYHAAFQAAFNRPDVTASNLISLRKRRGWKTGRTGQFDSGSKPWNTGKKGCAPGSEKGWFKKGQLPHNTKEAGHERVNRDGYVEISVNQTNPHTGYERRYVHKHVWLWEAANGPVPPGHVLKCLDSNKANSDPSNWELVSRGVLIGLNGYKRRVTYDQAAPELKPTLLALAKIEDKTRRLRRRRAAP